MMILTMIRMRVKQYMKHRVDLDVVTEATDLWHHVEPAASTTREQQWTQNLV
jgi:hypothetical protein